MRGIRELRTALTTMTNDVKSSGSADLPSSGQGQAATGAGAAGSEAWLKVGAVAAASAVLGGLAAAWYYRQTLARLQEAEETAEATGDPAEWDEDW